MVILPGAIVHGGIITRPMHTGEDMAFTVPGTVITGMRGMPIILILTGDITDITDTMHLYTAEWQLIIQVTGVGQVVI